MRPVTVSVGPLAAASANNIALSQTPTAGTATATFTASNPSIAATNTFVAGQIVTFTTTGQLPANFYPNTPYYIISTGLTGAAFEVSGSYAGTAVIPGAGQSGTQTVVATNSVALNGTLVPTSGPENGDAILDNPRRVLITTADTTHTFTITGEGPTGTILTESFLVVGGATYSQLDYTEVNSITMSGAATAAVTVGTNGIASTSWARMDEWANTQVSIQCDVIGSVNFTVQSTMNDPNSATNPVIPSSVNWINTNDSSAVGASASLQTNYLFSPTFIRVLLNSGTGSVTATIAQANVANR